MVIENLTVVKFPTILCHFISYLKISHTGILSYSPLSQFLPNGLFFPYQINRITSFYKIDQQIKQYNLIDCVLSGIWPSSKHGWSNLVDHIHQENLFFLSQHLSIAYFFSSCLGFEWLNFSQVTCMTWQPLFWKVRNFKEKNTIHFPS